MILEIISPEKKLFSGEAGSVTVPGSNGLFQVLNNHAPIISTLKKGTVKVETAEGEKSFEINGGVVEVLNNKVIVLAG
ncbi:MAG: ATP synthase F1 subunit epsilon [Bacteroidia bacterium]|nr:ATP synthase F1 subunit epsilon [Bacteroidia bacterium]